MSAYLTDLIKGSQTSFEVAAHIVQLIPSLAQKFVEDVTETLQSYLLLEEELLLKKFTSFQINKTAMIHDPETIIHLTLSYLHTLYIVCSSSTESNAFVSLQLVDLQKVLLVCHSSRSNEIAKLSSKCMGMIVKILKTLDQSLFAQWWESITNCISHPDSGVDPENGYILWLRCISAEAMNSSMNELQILLNSEVYWDYLQDGILNKTYEIRKYSLYILSQSLQKITNDINLKSMTWKIDAKEKYTFEWQRYITLVNIISIDTSLHQAEDSSLDLIKIIGQKSLIPKSWARCLLSTGLQSSMETLRKFVGNITLQLDSCDMEVFASGFEFLTDTLLPYLMLASHFTVEKTKTDVPVDFCPFGEKLSNFITSLLSYLDDDKCREACHCLLAFLYKMRLSFDPARIYIMYGVERALKGRQVLSQNELDILKSLFSASTETKLREKSLFYLYFRLLLSASKDVAFEGWFSTLNDIVGFDKVYLYLNASTEISEFIKSQKYIDEYKAYEKKVLSEQIPIYADISLSLGIKFDIKILENLPLADLLMILNCGIPRFVNLIRDPNIQLKLNKALKSEVASQDSNKFLILLANAHRNLPGKEKSILNFSDIISDYHSFIQFNWKELYCIDSINEANFEFILSRLTAINTLFTQPDFIYNSEIIESNEAFDFMSRLIIAKTPSKALTVIKNKALEEMYQIIMYISPSVDTTQLLDSFIDQIESVTSKCRFYICKTVFQLMKNDPQFVAQHTRQMVELVKIFWSSLVSDRLIATERHLHILFIQTFFFQDCLCIAVDDSDLALALENISKELLTLCYARRGLLCTLSEIILTYHASNVSVFAKWIGRLSISLFTFNQINDHLFKLEYVISSQSDNLRSVRLGSNSVPDSYVNEYGRPEIASKIDVISALASLNVESIRDLEYSKYLFNLILTSPKYHIFEPIKRNDGLEELERVRLYQLLLVTSRFMESDVENLENLTNNTLIPSLYTEPSPVVRTLIEWLIARFTFCLLEAGKTSIVMQKIDSEEAPRVLASYQRLGLMILRRVRLANSEYWIQYYFDYITKLIPFASSNRAAIRHFSVSILCAFTSEFNNTEIPSKLVDLILIINGITEYAQKSDNFKQYRSGENLIWDIEKDYKLTGICGSVLKKVSDRVLGEISEQEFGAYTQISSRLQIPLGIASKLQKWSPESEELIKPITYKSVQDSAPLQVKSIPWNSVIDVTVGEDGRDSDKVKRGELIVISSLVDKPPNLGGICRLCDVLGAKLLCINDISVTKTQQFKTVAVSADRWMPMLEVTQADIISFMMKKKSEGYTLIGLEQTDKSVELNSDLKFPKKSLILLGKEREGIPAEYLAELDFCVEIKQVGVIRSMNIQTATAVIVHSYAIQHC